MTSYIDILLAEIADDGRSVPLINEQDKTQVMELERAVLEYAQLYDGDFVRAMTKDYPFIKDKVNKEAGIVAKLFREYTEKEHFEQIIGYMKDGKIALPPSLRNDDLSKIFHNPKGGCTSYPLNQDGF